MSIENNSGQRAYMARRYYNLIDTQPSSWAHEIFLEKAWDVIPIHRSRQKTAENISPDVQYDKIAQELDIYPGDFDFVLTVIGDADFNEHTAVFGGLLSRTILAVNEQVYSKKEKLAVVTSATAGGAMWGVSEARWYRGLTIGKGNADYSRRSQCVVDYADGDFAFIGCVPQERVIYDGGTITSDDWMRDYAISQAVGRKRDNDMLSPHASHVIMTTIEGSPKEQWRTMSDTMCSFGGYISGDAKAVTLVIGGGEGSAFEVVRQLQQDARIVVVKGSGRLADMLVKIKENKTFSGSDMLLIDYMEKEMGKSLDGLCENIEIFDHLAYPHLTAEVEALSTLLTKK